MTHFKKGDSLRVINNLDEDGEPCEGALSIGEIVTMVDRSSEFRSFIIIERANGRQYQLETKRFELVEKKQ